MTTPVPQSVQNARNANRRHYARQAEEGYRKVSVDIPPAVVDFLNHLKQTTPGGFNTSAYIRDQLVALAKKHDWAV